MNACLFKSEQMTLDENLRSVDFSCTTFEDLSQLGDIIDSKETEYKKKRNGRVRELHELLWKKMYMSPMSEPHEFYVCPMERSGYKPKSETQKFCIYTRFYDKMLFTHFKINIKGWPVKELVNELIFQGFYETPTIESDVAHYAAYGVLGAFKQNPDIEAYIVPRRLAMEYSFGCKYPFEYPFGYNLYIRNDESIMKARLPRLPSESVDAEFLPRIMANEVCASETLPISWRGHNE